MLAPLQQNPIVVDVIRQPEATQDISLETALGWFAMAGVLLTAAVIGCLLVAGGTVLYMRWRDASRSPTEAPHSHTRLRIR